MSRLELAAVLGLMGKSLKPGGKVMGVPIEVTWEDDETKPQPAVQKATK